MSFLRLNFVQKCLWDMRRDPGGYCTVHQAVLSPFPQIYKWSCGRSFWHSVPTTVAQTALPSVIPLHKFQIFIQAAETVGLNGISTVSDLS